MLTREANAEQVPRVKELMAHQPPKVKLMLLSTQQPPQQTLEPVVESK